MSKRRANREGSKYRRKSDGRYVETSWAGREGKQKPKVFTGVTKEAARSKREEYEKQIAAGFFVAARSSMPLSSYVNVWLVDKKHELKFSTYKRYRELLLLYAVPSLGRLHLKDITASHIRLLLQELRETDLSLQTQRHVYSVLGNCLQDAFRADLIDVNPAHRVRVPRVQLSEVRQLLEEDEQRFVEGLIGRDFAGVVLLGMYGLRLGEIRALRWADVNLRRKELRVTGTLSKGEGGTTVRTPPKSQRAKRTFSLSDLHVAVLPRTRKQQSEMQLLYGEAWSDPFGLVFTRDAGRPIADDFTRRVLYPYCKELGIEPFTFHALRHKVSQAGHQEGGQPDAMRDLMGHSSALTTLDIYTRSVSPGKADALRRIDSRFGFDNPALIRAASDA